MPWKPSGSTKLAVRLDAAQVGVSELAALCGVHRIQVYRWRNGLAPVPRRHAERIGRYIGVDADMLVAEGRPPRNVGGER